MESRNIVVGQRVSQTKLERARGLRRESTKAETELWKHLRTNRLNGLHFRRQQIIDGFIVDCYCHAAGLVVEVDGGVHQQQTEQDAERDAVLSRRGLRVLRVRNEEVMADLGTVLAKIVQAAGT